MEELVLETAELKAENARLREQAAELDKLKKEEQEKERLAALRAKQVAVINAAVERYYIDHAAWPADDLSDIGADTEYFPDGVPKSPVDGSAYGLNTVTHRVLADGETVFVVEASQEVGPPQRTDEEIRTEFVAKIEAGSIAEQAFRRLAAELSEQRKDLAEASDGLDPESDSGRAALMLLQTGREAEARSAHLMSLAFLAEMLEAPTQQTSVYVDAYFHDQFLTATAETSALAKFMKSMSWEIADIDLAERAGQLGKSIEELSELASEEVRNHAPPARGEEDGDSNP